MQGFRYCTSNADMVITSHHHTEGGAAAFIRRNPNTPGMNVYKFPRPWAIAVGDLVPNAGVLVVPPGGSWHNKPKRKRIGE